MRFIIGLSPEFYVSVASLKVREIAATRHLEPAFLPGCSYFLVILVGIRKLDVAHVYEQHGTQIFKLFEEAARMAPIYQLHLVNLMQAIQFAHILPPIARFTPKTWRVRTSAERHVVLI
jgi:hypothetical protein